ncbi:6097_t:CDS:2, partial [Funneliformis caledonium]
MATINEIKQELKDARGEHKEAKENLKRWKEDWEERLKNLKRKKVEEDYKGEKDELDGEKEWLVKNKEKWEEQVMKLQNKLADFKKEKVNLSTRKLTSAKIKDILDKYVNNGKNSRRSLSNSENIPNDTVDISTYLKFVSRENAIMQLMKNMDKLHQLVTNPGEYAEPLKNLYFAAAVGTAGKGKTTFARRANENEDKYHGVVRPEIAVAVKNYEFKEEPEVVFGLRLLYEAMKYKLKKTEISTYENFREKFKGHFIALNEILD